MYAGAAVGVYPDVTQAAAEIVRFDAPVEPDPANHAAYRSLYENWRELYAGALKLSEAGLATALWRAPGT